MTSKGMFSALADDDDEPQQQQKVVQKKPVAQPKPQADVRPKTAKPIRNDDGEFEGVTGQEARRGGRGGQRGGRGGERGGRGGDRGGRGGFRGGRGERREGEEGGFRGGRGGFRGARRDGQEGDTTDRPRGGRGGFRGRGRGRPAGEGDVPEGDEGVLYVQRKERVDHLGKDEHFEGKKSEKWHQYDRRSGTGRGREVAKGGHGKGNWGKPGEEIKTTDEVEVTPKVEGEEATPIAEDAIKDAEGQDQPTVEVEEQQQVEEEEEKGGLTLQEYLAQKKTVNLKKEARKAENVNKANIEKVERTGDKVEQINKQLRSQDLYASGKGQGAELFGFQGGDDEFYPREERRGGRGGRGGFRGGRGGNRGGNQTQGSRPQRGGQSLRVDDDAFPTLG